MDLDGVISLLKIHVASAGGQSAWCRQNGVVPSYLSEVLRRKRAPGPKILDAVGVELAETRLIYRIKKAPPS